MTALFCSTLFRKSATSLMCTYVIIAVLFLAPVAAGVFTQTFAPRHAAARSVVEWTQVHQPLRRGVQSAAVVGEGRRSQQPGPHQREDLLGLRRVLARCTTCAAAGRDDAAVQISLARFPSDARDRRCRQLDDPVSPRCDNTPQRARRCPRAASCPLIRPPSAPRPRTNATCFRTRAASSGR